MDPKPKITLGWKEEKLGNMDEQEEKNTRFVFVKSDPRYKLVDRLRIYIS